MTKLTNNEIDILKNLIKQRLEEVDSQPDHTKLYWKPEVLESLNKKLDTMYFQ